MHGPDRTVLVAGNRTLRRSVPRARRTGAIRKALGRPQFWLGGITLIVAFGWYGAFVFHPMFKSFWISLLNYRVLDPESSVFVGLENFEILFTYDRFWIAVTNTLIYTVLTYVLSLPVSLLFSWCIANVVHGRRFYEFVVFLPFVVSLVAIAMLFRMIMNPDSGALNRIISSMGLPTSDWIFGTSSALLSVAIVDVWKSLGFFVVLLTGAMLAVSPELQDAARVDGAGGWGVFRHVTVPSIMPTLALVSIFTILTGLNVYVTPTVLGPGPGTSTLMINEFIVEEAFTSFNMSSATATSVVLFIFMLILTVIQLRVLRPRT
jgi:ABC-type sugar transport system permease subunit